MLSSDSHILEIQLATADRDAIASNTQLATSASNTILNVSAGAFSDMFSTPIASVIQSVSVFGADHTQPSLLSFNVSLNTGEIIFAFDETMNVTSMNITAITLHSDQALNASRHTFVVSASSRVTTPDASSVTIKLSASDLNMLKSLIELAVSHDTTYVTLPSAVIADSSTNTLPAVDGAQVLGFTPDTTQPRLIYFDLDMSRQTMFLTFSETVNASTFRIDQLSVLSERTSSARVIQLTSGRSVQLSHTTLQVWPSNDDFNELKKHNDIATASSNTFIAATSDTIKDMNNNMLETRNTTTALPVSAFTGDTVQPALQSFNFDLDSSTLTLYFSETVDVQTTDVTSLELASTSQAFALTVGSYSTQPSPNVTIQLTKTDVDELKRQEICLASSSCFIQHSSSFVSDKSGNAITATTANDSLRVDEFSPDVTPPSLVQFVLFDFNSLTLSLNFSETVRSSSVRFSGLRLNNVYGPPASSVVLGGGQAISQDGLLFTMHLLESDIHNIKLGRTICSAQLSCFVRLESGFLQDMTGNNNTAVLIGPLVTRDYPTTFLADTVGPSVSAFTLDMDEGTLHLTFNEVISISTLQYVALTIQDAFDRSVSRPITGGSLLSTNTDRLDANIRLNTDDRTNLKANFNLASSLNTTWLVHTTALAQDAVSNNPAQARVNNASALQASVFIPDTTAPSLESFLEINLGSRELRIKFSEAVDLATFEPSRFLLVNDSSSPGATHRLGADSTIRYDTSDNTKQTVVVTLSALDLLGAKETSGLAKSLATTFLQLETGAIQDPAGNNISATVSHSLVRSYVADNSPPDLLAFSVDMNTGRLFLTFDDVVQTNTFESTALTLVGSTATSPTTYRLVDLLVWTSDRPCICES